METHKQEDVNLLVQIKHIQQMMQPIYARFAAPMAHLDIILLPFVKVLAQLDLEIIQLEYV